MSKRRDEILNQAMALMIREGITGLTMKKIAGRVGFTEPALYRHFKDKRDLVVALIGRIRVRFEEVVSKVDGNLPPDQYFKALLCPLLAYLEEVRGITVLLLSESTFTRDDVVRAALFSFYGGMTHRVAQYLKEAQERKEVRKDLNPESGSIILVGIIQSLTIRFLLSEGELKIIDKCDEVLDIFLKGVVE